MGLIRFFFTLAVLGVLVYLGATVNLGQRTLFGHIANIWSSQEAQELRDDVGDTTSPVLKKTKRGAKAGWDEYLRDPPQADAPDPASSLAPPVEGADLITIVPADQVTSRDEE